MKETLLKIEAKLKELKKKHKRKLDYSVPALWIDPYSANIAAEPVDVYDFFIAKIEEILNGKEVHLAQLPKNEAFIYNMLPRYVTAFDHNNDGEISKDDLPGGFRETGTFLKSIAILPYIKSLGADIIYLLPVTSIGVDGNKGNLGSPYAIRDHYELDERLAEPALEMDVKEQLKAFVDAAHLLGMKVILEFVFRTASVDSDLALKHPDWFYWIHSNIQDRVQGDINEKHYGPPIFNDKELEEIKRKVYSHDFKSLPKPHEEHIKMFVPPPQKVARVEEKIVGVNKQAIGAAKGRKNETYRIPSAFADWPPDDIQPPWSDVTYLRLYEDPKFNYIAYNTVRMYDEKLIKGGTEITELWEHLENIIPFYEERYDIDGVMIDMGHALPTKLRSEIISRARNRKPNFIFWEENFHLDEKSVLHGYNASLGELPFFAHRYDIMLSFLQRLEKREIPINFFAGPETHNVHRSASRPGGIMFSRFIFAVCSLMPALKFVHAGLELGEKTPVNTGLGFTVEEQRHLPPTKLPLFSAAKLDWTSEDVWTDDLRAIVEIYKGAQFCGGLDKGEIKVLKTHGDNILAFLRYDKDREEDAILFAGSMAVHPESAAIIYLPEDAALGKVLYGKKHFHREENKILANFGSFEFMLAQVKLEKTQ